jgi:hypothetical protein
VDDLHAFQDCVCVCVCVFVCVCLQRVSTCERSKDHKRGPLGGSEECKCVCMCVCI